MEGRSFTIANNLLTPLEGRSCLRTHYGIRRVRRRDGCAGRRSPTRGKDRGRGKGRGKDRGRARGTGKARGRTAVNHSGRETEGNNTQEDIQDKWWDSDEALRRHRRT